jgi:hypothetical protein
LFISKNYYRRYVTGCNYPADSEWYIRKSMGKDARGS